MNISLDLIIPAYNAKKTINRALYSIAFQKYIKGLKVYIINDCSDYDYSKEVSFFSKFFDIFEIKLEKNSGPGIARNKGIEVSNSKYIMFMDSDDYLYDPFAITNMYTCISKNKKDLVVSNFLLQRDGRVELTKRSFVWLHGKIYKRSFLKKNDIYFNDTRSNEDNGFNRVVLLSSPDVYYLDRLTYVYYDYENSITRKNDRKFKFTGLEGYTYNMNWAMQKFIAKKENLEEVARTATGVLIAMYYYYLELYEQYKSDIDKILIWSKDIKKVYDKYKKRYITPNMINQALIEKDNEYQKKEIEINKIISFEEFLQKVDEIK